MAHRTPVAKELNQNIASFVNRNYSTAVPNGTIAIYLALLSAGLKKEVKLLFQI